MDVSWLAMMLVPALLLLGVGLVVGVVALVANAKTRSIALGLVGAIAVAAVLLGVLFLGHTRTATMREVELHQQQIEAKLAEVEAIRAQAAEATAANSHGHGEAATAPADAAFSDPEFEAEMARVRAIEQADVAARAHTEQTRMKRMSILVFSPIVFLVTAGLLAILGYLLVNPKTRRAVLGVMALMAGFAVVIGVGFFGLTVYKFQGVPTVEALPPRAVEVEEIPVGHEIATTAVSDTTVPETLASEPEPVAEAPAAPTRPKSLLKAVGSALARAADEAKKEKAEQAMAELAEAPAFTVEPAEPAGPARPDWVESEADRNAEGDYQMPIYVGPYATRSECHDALPARLNKAVDAYAVALLGPEARNRVHFSPAYLEGHVVRDTWEEWKEYEPPLGKMVKLHVLVEFDDEAKVRIEDEFNRIVVRGRLWAVGIAGSVLLVLLSTAWGYLRIDLATGGSYRRRLRVGAGAVFLALLAAGLIVLS